MRKSEFILTLVLTTMLFVSACGRSTDLLNSQKPNNSNCSSKASAASAVSNSGTSGIDGFAIGKYDIAASDNDGNVYIISRTQLGKINKQGNVSVLTKGLIYGQDIALHNNYIYYIDGTDLCRIDKDGKNKCKFSKDSLFKHGISTIYIYGDVIYITALGDNLNNTKTNKYWADISKDPNTFTWNKGTKDFNYDKLNKNDALKSALGSDFAKFDLDKVNVPFTLTNEYLYYITSNQKLMRMNKKNGESENLSIKSSVIEKTTIIKGWIYYWNDGYMYRTNEDYSKTEKLMESPLMPLP